MGFEVGSDVKRTSGETWLTESGKTKRFVEEKEEQSPTRIREHSPGWQRVATVIYYLLLTNF